MGFMVGPSININKFTFGIFDTTVSPLIKKAPGARCTIFTLDNQSMLELEEIRYGDHLRVIFAEHDGICPTRILYGIHNVDRTVSKPHDSFRRRVEP